MFDLLSGMVIPWSSVWNIAKKSIVLFIIAGLAVMVYISFIRLDVMKEKVKLEVEKSKVVYKKFNECKKRSVYYYSVLKNAENQCEGLKNFHDKFPPPPGIDGRTYIPRELQSDTEEPGAQPINTTDTQDSD